MTKKKLSVVASLALLTVLVAYVNAPLLHAVLLQISNTVAWAINNTGNLLNQALDVFKQLCGGEGTAG